ncbi:MAG: glycosyltransferase family 4 protein [Actinomycetota bacterium]|nr:glycosyltransferase family 4 protein [Actinomycetota bacterium]
MKVAIVCPYAWDRPGGVQSHIRSLSPVLRTRGHEVEVFAPETLRLRRDAGREEAEADITAVGRAIDVPANGSIAPIAFGPVAAVRIRRLLARFDPDVIHLHEPLIPSLPMLALLSASAPTVGTFHAAAPYSVLYRISKPLLARVESRLTARTAVSEAARLLIARYFPGEIASTPNGVNVAQFADAPPMDLGPGPTVLFLGRLEPRKGADVLVRAMALLPDLRASLAIAGEGRMRSRLHALATQLGVEAHFLGAVSEVDKARLFRSSDVYCAPNLGGESFGIVLVEAMASGRPVVCSDLKEFRDVAGDAAIFAPAGRPAVLADALRSVLSDPEGARTMGEKASARARAFDWNRLVPNVETIYERASATAH